MALRKPLLCDQLCPTPPSITTDHSLRLFSKTRNSRSCRLTLPVTAVTIRAVKTYDSRRCKSSSVNRSRFLAQSELLTIAAASIPFCAPCTSSVVSDVGYCRSCIRSKLWQCRSFMPNQPSVDTHACSWFLDPGICRVKDSSQSVSAHIRACRSYL